MSLVNCFICFSLYVNESLRVIEVHPDGLFVTIANVSDKVRIKVSVSVFCRDYIGRAEDYVNLYVCTSKSQIEMTYRNHIDYSFHYLLEFSQILQFIKIYQIGGTNEITIRTAKKLVA